MTTQFSNTKFFPLTYVVKYDPPMIGMVYKLSEKDTKKRIYKIYLHGLIYKNDPEQITRQLFQEHALHINENVVSHKQIKNLVTKILQMRTKKSEGSSPGERKPAGVNAMRSDLLNIEEGKKAQDFARNKAQGNKYAYQDEDDEEEEEHEYDQRGDHDNLEFDGEIEDLEGDNDVFDYGNYGSGSRQKGAAQAGFIKSLADKKAQEKPSDDMDFILDDPDNLDNFSDY